MRLALARFARRSWLVLLAPWVVGLCAFALAISLDERSDKRREAELTLATLHRQIDEVPLLPLRAAPGGEATPAQVAAELRRREDDAEETIDRLDTLVTDDLPEVIREAVGPYFEAIHVVLGFIATLTLSDSADAPIASQDPLGDRDNVTPPLADVQVSQGAVENDRDRITAALTAASADYSAQAARARLLAYVGSGVGMLITLLAFSAAQLAAGRARRREQCLAQENVRLLDITRHEAVTDALTGLGNRRRLMSDAEKAIAAATREEPVVLAIFDLDGFKTYNDTFGHPAGDALLSRLGHQLTEAVTSNGTAYRMGGDEFCVLAQTSDVDALITCARSALTEHGEWFSVTACGGAVRLPEEADNLRDALHLADERMYAAKRDQRASPTVQARDALLQVLAEQSSQLGSHASSVAALAGATAIRLGLPEDEIPLVRLAAELHDIGKTAIPEAILSKPGPLDSDEWEFVKRHTLIGERILIAAPALANVASLVRASHERVDGHGYPDGLRADDIPMGARIVAVADAFDAMLSHRPYRPALSTSEAIEELRRGTGTQFDPEVVEAFLSVLSTMQLTDRAA